MDRMFLFLSAFDVGLKVGAQFLLEGLITVAVAGFAYLTMHDVRFLPPPSISYVPFLDILDCRQYPATARFLSAEERDFVVNRLKHDSSDLATHYEHKFVIQALTDWKCWMQVCIYIGYAPLSPLSPVLPS